MKSGTGTIRGQSVDAGRHGVTKFMISVWGLASCRERSGRKKRKVVMKKFMLGAAALVTGASACLADGTDLDTTISTVSGYWTSVEAIAVGVLLFVIGRRIVKKV